MTYSKLVDIPLICRIFVRAIWEVADQFYIKSIRCQFASWCPPRLTSRSAHLHYVAPCKHSSHLLKSRNTDTYRFKTKVHRYPLALGRKYLQSTHGRISIVRSTTKVRLYNGKEKSRKIGDDCLVTTNPLKSGFLRSLDAILFVYSICVEKTPEFHITSNYTWAFAVSIIRT